MADHVITPSQTIGPFFAFALSPTAYSYAPLSSNDLVTPDAVGARIVVRGIVHDGAGAMVPDALVEIWQCDGNGHYPSSDTAPLPTGAFTGFGRSECNSRGQYSFTTVKPGRVPGPGGRAQAPHLNLGLFARGLLVRLCTRVYFADEPANEADPMLALVPEERRATLLARREGDEHGVPVYVLDLFLQGEQETVFFDI